MVKQCVLIIQKSVKKSEKANKREIEHGSFQNLTRRCDETSFQRREFDNIIWIMTVS